MRLKKGLKALGLFFITVCMAIPLTAQADMYIKQKNHSDGFSMMGQPQPPKDDLFVTWMSKDKARMDHGEDASVIIRLDKKMIYTINHAEMTYMEMPFDEKIDILTAAFGSSDLSDEEQTEAKKMMAGLANMMAPKVSVKETGETKKINEWKCKKYIMTTSMIGAITTTEVWATEEIKIDYELYSTILFSMMPKTPGLEKMLEEMKKINGITVLSTASMPMMGKNVKSTQELLEVAEKSAPTGTYKVPKGYKKQR